MSAARTASASTGAPGSMNKFWSCRDLVSAFFSILVMTGIDAATARSIRPIDNSSKLHGVWTVAGFDQRELKLIGKKTLPNDWNQWGRSQTEWLPIGQQIKVSLDPKGGVYVGPDGPEPLRGNQTIFWTFLRPYVAGLCSHSKWYVDCAVTAADTDVRLLMMPEQMPHSDNPFESIDLQIWPELKRRYLRLVDESGVISARVWLVSSKRMYLWLTYVYPQQDGEIEAEKITVMTILHKTSAR